MGYFAETIELLETKQCNKTPKNDHPASNGFKTARDKKEYDRQKASDDFKDKVNTGDRARDRVMRQREELAKDPKKYAKGDLNHAKVLDHSYSKRGDAPRSSEGWPAEAKLNHRSVKESVEEAFASVIL